MNLAARHKKNKSSSLLKLPHYEESKLTPEVTCFPVLGLYALPSAVKFIKVRPPHKFHSTQSEYMVDTMCLFTLTNTSWYKGSSRQRSSVSIQGFKSNLALVEHKVILRDVSFSKRIRAVIHLVLSQSAQHDQAYIK